MRSSRSNILDSRLFAQVMYPTTFLVFLLLDAPVYTMRMPIHPDLFQSGGEICFLVLIIMLERQHKSDAEQ